MKTIFFLLFIQLIVSHYCNAQTFQIDTLQYNGDIDKYINIVVMGDGYTASEQDKFSLDAKHLTNYLFTQSPWSEYLNYFNIFAIKVISRESGAMHPGTASDCGAAWPVVPVSNPDTYFGSTFDYAGIHRLFVPTNTSAIVNVLANYFPNYDQVFIIGNTPYYGGSGGTWATSTAHASSGEISVHELGHSFAHLADEYNSGYFAEHPNQTQQADPSLVKWANWIGYNGVGMVQYCCGGQSSLWYRPTDNSCKMQALGLPLCSVCSEATIETIHSLVNPIASYAPTELAINAAGSKLDFALPILIKPVPNSLKIVWKLDDDIVAQNVDSTHINQNFLATGLHHLTVTVVDTNTLVRANNHATLHLSTVTWTINKSSKDIGVTSTENKIACSLFPNPTSKDLNISVESERPDPLSIQIISTEGKVVLKESATLINGKYLSTLDIEHLASGTYAVVFRVGDIVHTQQFTKI